MFDDLRARLAQTRWIDDLNDPGWDHGLSVPYMRELAAFWQDQFDWRAEERALNSFDNFIADLKGSPLIHFIHERGHGPSPLPIILTHGFPDSVLRFSKIIPMLADPARYGGDAEDAFDVIVPSLPGYGFSGKPSDGMLFEVGDLWHRLMTEELGYARYAAHGGDWGSTITEFLARDHADAVVGIHLTDVPFFHSFQKPGDPSRAEKKYLDVIAKFPQTEGAYALVQGSRPQALALGLNDSPMGLASWIIEKFRRWSDCDGDVEKSFTKDELLANPANGRNDSSPSNGGPRCRAAATSRRSSSRSCWSRTSASSSGINESATGHRLSLSGRRDARRARRSTSQCRRIRCR